MSCNTKVTELRRWKFTLDQHRYGLGAGWAMPQYDDSLWTPVETCTAWETYEYALADYEGHGWFRTCYDGVRTAGRCHILQFDGVGGVAQVYVNGCYVGGTEDRYLPFQVDITAALKDRGPSVIAVLVDNSFRGSDHLPGGKTTEWVLYGGLTHRIRVEDQPAAYMENVRIDAAADGTFRALVTCESRETRSRIPAFAGQVTVSVEGLPELTCTQEVTLEHGEKKVLTFAGRAETVKTWSPDSPNLYNVTVTMTRDGREHHALHERIGFRTIEVSGTDFLLNGQKLFLKGANRYDEYAPYGNCPPEELIRADLLKMKECGLNLVRTHYPQDALHYRIADEVGIMYMIEVPLNWWYPTDEVTFADCCGLAAEAIANTDGTFKAFSNHPCWTVWSVGNECFHSHPACQHLFRLVAQRMRSYEPGRLITFAANKPLRDSHELDFCDFLSLNKYTGCLSNHEDQFAELIHGPLRAKLDEARRYYPDIPHVMTEFGIVTVHGVGGSAHEGRFNGRFGAAFLEAQLKIFLEDENLRGMVIWSWADYRHRRGFAGGGMHLNATFGPYGLVTIDRKVKEPVFKSMQNFYTNWNP